jgi:hypothetical protein
LRFLWHLSCIAESQEQGGEKEIMGSKVIKVIKKNSQSFQSPARPERINVKASARKTIHGMEENIKGWIADLQGRKHEELVQAHSLLGGI